MRYPRILLVLIAVFMTACSFTGCGSSEVISDESYKKITDKGELVLGFDDNFPPMGFKDESGNYVGFDIDVARETCKRLGVDLKLQPINWDEKEKDLNEGRIDCIWNGLSVNSDRQESMNLSEPYMENQLVFVVRKDSACKTTDDLKGKTVGTQAGSSTEAALSSASGIPEIKTELADDNVKLFDMLDENMIDAVFLDSIVAYYYIAENNKDYYVLPTVLDNEDFAIGFRKDDQVLRDVVQKMLHEMKEDGTLARISTEWFGTDVTIVK